MFVTVNSFYLKLQMKSLWEIYSAANRETLNPSLSLHECVCTVCVSMSERVDIFAK